TTARKPRPTTRTSSNAPPAGRRFRRSRPSRNASRAMSPILKVSLSAAALALAACVSMPTGPAVMVLPGTGKSFDEFRFDDGTCRQFAYEQIGGHTAAQAQQDAAVSSAVVGTVLGAAAGAAIGGNSAGAATGAGVGLLGGSMYGASASSYSGYDAQH